MTGLPRLHSVRCLGGMCTIFFVFTVLTAILAYVAVGHQRLIEASLFGWATLALLFATAVANQEYVLSIERAERGDFSEPKGWLVRFLQFITFQMDHKNKAQFFGSMAAMLLFFFQLSVFLVVGAAYVII